ncbi:MAG: ABC transporter permease [Parasporobacterium sp.]|nr:ABC transporter permease [Parasporobacterium sp.]
MKKTCRVITVIIFIFLYVPIFLLALASFNSGNDIAVFKEFTFSRYAELFRDSSLLELVRNSFIIAITSTIVATILGTMAAVGLTRLGKRMRSLILSVTNLPMMNPDIVTGVSLALMFAFAGTLLRLNSVMGFWTLLIAHVTFNLPFVILNVLPRMHQMDPNLTDAAMDLGCTPVQAFFKVTIHDILPGIISGALMSFTMSLDDFVISYFVTGFGFITLPVEIYNYTKKPIHPKVYALFTLMFLVILILMIVMNLIQSKNDRTRKQKFSKAGGVL